jgi:hypothetical protein
MSGTELNILRRNNQERPEQSTAARSDRVPGTRPSSVSGTTRQPEPNDPRSTDQPNYCFHYCCFDLDAWFAVQLNQEKVHNSRPVKSSFASLVLSTGSKTKIDWSSRDCESVLNIHRDRNVTLKSIRDKLIAPALPLQHRFRTITQWSRILSI